MRNRRLILWLKENLGGKGFEIHADETSGTAYSYSRFSRSRQDFSFYKITNSQDSFAARVFVPEREEYFDFTAGAGDNKDEIAESDKAQLIANMSKTVADVAHSAVQANMLPRSITVYGLLVDYKYHQTRKVYKMKCDFEAGEVNLLQCEETNIPIEQSFQDVTAILNQSLITH